MSGQRLRFINQWYFWGWDSRNASNDAADEIIATPEKHLMCQEDLFAAQGGFTTVGCALAATAVGTIAVFAGSPRTASHFRNGQCNFSEWACLGSSAVFWYLGASWAGQKTFGDSMKVHNHWMAYTFVKNQNRFEGRRSLSKKPWF